MTRCLICHEKVEYTLSWGSLIEKENHARICQTCDAHFEELTGEQCSLCSRVLAEHYRQGQLCLDCCRWENESELAGYLTCNQSLFLYNNFLKEVMAKYKYRGDYALCEVFASMLGHLRMEKALITAIPLSEERLMERGFNQVVAILDVLKIKHVQVLSRLHSEKQAKKSREERLALHQIFQVSNPSVIKDKKIMIVDDVYTTGSTIRHAAKALVEAGAREVQSCTIAR